MHSFRLRELLEELGRRQGRRLSMRDLSAATGISPQVLSKMNDPKGYVTNTAYVERLCRYFGITPTELFAFDRPVNPAGERSQKLTEAQAAVPAPPSDTQNRK